MRVELFHGKVGIMYIFSIMLTFVYSMFIYLKLRSHGKSSFFCYLTCFEQQRS